MAREVNTKALLDLMATRLIALLDTVGSAVYLCEEGEQGLLAHSAKGVLSHSLLSRRRLGEGLVGAAADARQGILANAYPRSRYVLPSVLEPATVEAAMVEPLVLRGRLLGVLQVVRDAAGGPFTDEDQFAIRLFAKTAALALEHARLFTELSEAFGRLQVLQEEALRVEKLQTLGALTSGMVFGLNQVLAQVLGQVEHLGGLMLNGVIVVVFGLLGPKFLGRRRQDREAGKQHGENHPKQALRVHGFSSSIRGRGKLRSGAKFCARRMMPWRRPCTRHLGLVGRVG